MELLLFRNAWLSCFVLISFLCDAQTAPGIEWQNSIGGTKTDEGSSIHQTKDSGFILAGSSNSYDGDIENAHGNFDMMVVKLTQNGSINWSKNYGGHLEERAKSIKQTYDGGYIVAGLSSSYKKEFADNYGRVDAWLVKLNDTGRIEWDKNYGGSMDETFKDVYQTLDSGYILLGTTQSNDFDVSGYHGNGDYWVVKADAQGTIKWQKCLGGTWSDEGNSIIQTHDSGYILIGSSISSNGDITNPKGNYDIWIVKLNADGSIQWQKNYGGTNADFASTGPGLGNLITEVSDGYVFCGQTYSNDLDVTGNHGVSDYWVVKINEEGIIQWQWCYGGSHTECPFAISQTSDNGYIITGYSASRDGDVEGNHNGINNYTGDYWIVKLDSLGILQWQKCLGGTSHDEGRSIEQTIDGGYIVTGSAASGNGDVVGSHGAQEAWTVKLLPNVLPVSLISFTLTKKEKSVLLNWQTANETNNNYFVVERTENTNWKELTRIYSKGNSFQIQSYAYEDSHPSSGQNFYRLKQVDKDGKFTYSNIVSVDFENGIAILLYPNPVKNVLNIEGLNTSSTNNLSIVDMKGKIVVTTISIDVHYAWNVQSLAKGIYYLRIETNGKMNTMKFVKE